MTVPADPVGEALAVWHLAAQGWLERVDAAIAGRLMPQDAALLQDDFGPLQKELLSLGRRMQRAGRPPGAAPVEVAPLEQRMVRQVVDIGDRILAQFPAPGAAGMELQDGAEINLPAAVDLMTFLERAPGRLFRRPANVARRRRLTVQLAALGERYHRQVMDGLAASERDPHKPPEEPVVAAAAPADASAAARDSLRIANFNQIRMDLLIWLLEALDDHQAAHQIRHLSRITARAAVRRVDQALIAYLDGHEPETRMRLRPVLEAVDEVLALIRSVVQQSEEGDGKVQYFVRDLGAEVTEPFIRHMGLLVIALLDDMQSANGQGGLGAAALRGGLQRIEEVLAFCRVIDHPLGRDAYARAVRVIGMRGDRLVEELAQRMATGNDAGVAEIRKTLLVLEEFVERWRDRDIAHRAEGRDE